MKRKPGRPPLDPTEPSVFLTARISARAYDALYTRARAARCSMSELVRRELDPNTKTPKYVTRN